MVLRPFPTSGPAIILIDHVGGATSPEAKSRIGLQPTLVTQERELIEAALAETRGRVSGPDGAARKLGIPRSTLEYKIQSLCIDKNRYRVEARELSSKP
jgi:DNA-binding NtrC family response regulator